MNLPDWTAAPQPDVTVTHSTGDAGSELVRRMYAAVATAYFSEATLDALDWGAPPMAFMEFSSHDEAVAAMELLAMPATGGVQ